MKQITQTFLEGESPTLNHSVINMTLELRHLSLFGVSFVIPKKKCLSQPNSDSKKKSTFSPWSVLHF